LFYFFPQCHPTSKDILPFNKSQNFTLSLKLSTFMGASFTFGEAGFYKIKGRERFRRTHNLSTTEDTLGLTETFPASAEL
jgi:hypothetical protein